MALHGIIGAMTFQGNRHSFSNFCQGSSRTVLVARDVVMDNFSSHLVTGVKEAIESVGAKLVYLSLFPRFSPIENCWSSLKEFLRSPSRTYEQLDIAITEAFKTITLQDILGWFQHCGYVLLPIENRYI